MILFFFCGDQLLRLRYSKGGMVLDYPELLFLRLTYCG